MPGFQRRRNAVQLEDRINGNDGATSEGPTRQRFAVVISYDGTDFQGFQSQPHGNTIQDTIEHRLERLLQRKVRIFSSGRTDCGVHANGAVFHVDLLQTEVDRFQSYNKGSAAEFLLDVLRRGIPTGSVAILASSVTAVPSDFDARFSCIEKEYIAEPLNIERMNSAVNLLSGKHDFSWLAVNLPGELRDPVRNLCIEIERQESCSCAKVPVVKITFKCDFFLYRMVRRIVGLLVKVGLGKVTLDEIKVIMCIVDADANGKRREQVKVPKKLLDTAPASGLSLHKDAPYT